MWECVNNVFSGQETHLKLWNLYLTGDMSISELEVAAHQEKNLFHSLCEEDCKG